MDKCQGIGCNAAEQNAAREQQEAAVRGSLDKIKHKFLVMSGKGGVGKTSVSVNLATALANKNYKVGLLDVDIHGPDVPHMLGLKGMLDLNERQRLTPMNYSDNLFTVSLDSLIPNKDDAIIWRGPMKHQVIRQFISDVEWGSLDYLIIDSPPGTGDEPLSVAQTISDAKAIIVTTPQEIALADVRKSINFCKTVKMEIFGVIENMSGFDCPHCGKTIDIFGSGGGEKTAAAFNVPFLGKIPFDPKVVSCGDAGSSYQDMNPDSAVTQAFATVAGEIAKVV